MIPWLAALLLFLIDQSTKAYVYAHFRDGRLHAAVPSLLDFVFVENTRGAYGLFGDKPWFLIMIAVVAFAVIYLTFRDRAAHSVPLAVALGCVLGGAIGNVVDRLHYGFVVDFIRIIPLPFFEVFNIADMGITLGIVTIIILSLRNKAQT